MSTGLAEFIAENYRSHMDLTWDYPHLGYARARFSPDKNDVDLETTVDFELREVDGPWYASFRVSGLDTGAGVRYAFDIFNGVIQAVEEFLEVREPNVLIIAAKHDQLARIYEMYLRREAPALERLGYELEGRDRVEPFTEFTLRRVKPTGWKIS